MIRRAFLRALWGDALIPRSRTKISRDVRISTTYRYPLPTRTYCYGLDNRRLLRENGVEPIMLSKVGIVNFFGRCRRRASSLVNWGCNMWRHKLVAIAAALDDCDEVVWLDWDCLALHPLPDGFWERLALGAPVQASLRQYHRIKCPWRSTGRRLVPGGAFLYVRGRDTIDELLDLHAENRRWDDETTIARWTDLQQGGWQSCERYVEDGFEPFCYQIRGQVFPPEVPLFTAG